MLKTERNNKSKDRSNRSLLLFGHGDGGGGPQRRMLDQLHRARGIDGTGVHGLPTVRFATPLQFFEDVERDHLDRPLAEWQGELYFEYHRGTYTTHAAVKKSNRRCEDLLHDLEFLLAAARALGGPEQRVTDDERVELLALWQALLQNQFHDV